MEENKTKYELFPGAGPSKYQYHTLEILDRDGDFLQMNSIIDGHTFWVNKEDVFKQ